MVSLFRTSNELVEFGKQAKPILEPSVTFFINCKIAISLITVSSLENN